MTYWAKFMKTINSPAKIIFAATNIALVFIILTLTTIAIRTWMDPKYSDKVDVDLVTYAPKTLEPLYLTRKTNSARIIDSVVQANLFRQERREYIPPVQIVKSIDKPDVPALPPPNIKLKGVILLGSRKIAIMEGDYPVREEGQAIKKKPLKRKGYPLGAKIGSFKLTKIEKTNVTLNNNRGVVLNLNLAQRQQEKIIQRVGKSLVQNSKNFEAEKIKKASLPGSASFTIRKRPPRKPKPVGESPG